MTVFTVDISDPGQLAGIADARAAFNESLTPSVDGNGDPIAVQNRPGYIATDAAYFTARIADIFASYSKQFGYDLETIMALKSEVAARTSRMTGAGISVPDGP